MGAKHIITISEDAINLYGDDKEALASELGSKVLSLCKNWVTSKSTTEPLGDFIGAICWRGHPDTSADELFYCGADLKALSQLNTKELEIAKRLIEKEISSR
jgi:hypothetical protein